MRHNHERRGSRSSVRAHARAVLALGLPLIGSHMAQFAIHVTDAIMLGWYDVGALAAVVLAQSFFFLLFIMGSGFAWAVTPLVASAEASGQPQQVRRITRMGMWIVVLYAAVLLPLLLWSEALLLAMGQTDDVAAAAQIYLRIAAWGMFPALLVMVLKSHFAALERTQVVLWATVLAAVLNAAVNWVLIFGHLGMPELGLRGAAIASVLTQLLTLAVLVAYANMATPEHALFQRLWRPDREVFGTVFHLGWPIGLTSLAESGLFSASAVMMGWLGEVTLAAHGIALQLVGFAFMVHVGLSNAATVRAGRAAGQGDEHALRLGGLVAIGLSTGVALFTTALFLWAPEPLLSIFVDPSDPMLPRILAVGTGLLAMAGVFQLADGAQVMALGLLRGVQDARVPMLYAGLSYWLIGMPVSYLLGFRLGFGGVGVWAGLVIGLGLAAILLMVRFWTRSVRLPPLPAVG